MDLIKTKIGTLKKEAVEKAQLVEDLKVKLEGEQQKHEELSEENKRLEKQKTELMDDVDIEHTRSMENGTKLKEIQLENEVLLNELTSAKNTLANLKADHEKIGEEGLTWKAQMEGLEQELEAMLT
jgi:predicted transcriptional regulator